MSSSGSEFKVTRALWQQRARWSRGAAASRGGAEAFMWAMLNPARTQPFALFLDRFSTGEWGTPPLRAPRAPFTKTLYFPPNTEHARKPLIIAEGVLSRSDRVYSPLMWSYECLITARLCRSFARVVGSARCWREQRSLCSPLSISLVFLHFRSLKCVMRWFPHWWPVWGLYKRLCEVEAPEAAASCVGAHPLF